MGKLNKYDADVIRLHGLGWSQRRIANELGTSQGGVSRTLLRLGMRSSTIPGKHDEQIVGLYKSGMTVRDVAATLKISPSTVMAALKRMKVQRRRSGVAPLLSEVETASVLQQSQNGVSAEDLSKQFDCSAQTIYNIRHRAKVKQ